jgi:hypothetical protein
MENNKTFTLMNGDKASLFDFHQIFLSSHHRYRKNRKDFLKGKAKKDVAPR